MYTRLVPDPSVDTIASAPAPGRGVVTAIRIPAEHVIYAACSRHGVLVTNTYGPDATHDEIRAGTTAAVICTQAHARGCTADRVKRSVLAATGAGAQR